MSVPHLSPRGVSPRRLFGFAILGAALLAVVGIAGFPNARTAEAAPPGEKPKETLVDGLPLFSGWPAKQIPDAVIVFTGQTYGYLQPCGCSRPQMGGLERRAVFIESLKTKGWPVAGVDLGDIYPEKVALAKQGQLKYVATMNALRDMGYLGVGIGQTEIKGNLFRLLADYSLQKEQRPFVLAGNAGGMVQGKAVPRLDYFPIPAGAKRPIVEEIEVGKLGGVSVGVAGVVGKSLQDENTKQKWDDSLDFPNAKAAITGARDALAKHADKPALKVLIFQGPLDDAKKVAKDFPEFQVILCQSESDLPPLQPTAVNHNNGTKTLIVQVGHRGQHVGVLGAFKNKDGGFDLKYQLVPLGEEYITPGKDAEAIKNNKALQALDTYAKDVKAANLLPKYPRTPHPAQIGAQSLKPPVALSYVGTDACKGCHAAEHAKWKLVPHSHAMATLQNIATRPNLREFDGECVKCHTVGFDYQTGAYDPKNAPAQNLLLHNVGCESCHGPGSGHVAAPGNKTLLPLLSPWKQEGAAKLPDAKFMKEMADTPAPERGQKAIPPAQQMLLLQVENMCMKCHDHEADPHFDLYKQWTKIDHSGLAPKGGWPVKAP